MDTDWKYSGLGDLFPTNESWRQEVLLKAFFSTEFFANYFLVDTFRAVNNWQRKENFLALDDDSIPFGYVMAYRGFGKTTQLFAHLVKQTCFRMSPFTLYTGKTGDYAETQTENIKAELLTNPAILEFFGNMKPKPYLGTSKEFSAKAFFLSDPKSDEPFAFFSPRGSRMQVRGSLIRLKGGMYRPTFIVSDDGEDDEEVLNEDLRKKYRKWFYGALLPCVGDVRPNPVTGRWDKPDFVDAPHWRPPWRVWQQDTNKHEDANMTRITQDGQWVGHVYPQAEKRSDGKYYTLTPEIVSDEQVRKEQKQAVKNGNEDWYAMEFLCLSQALDGAGWTKDLFEHYNDSGAGLNELDRNDKWVIVDPAKTTKAKSADTAILGQAVRCNLRKLYFRDLISKRMPMEDMPKRALEMCMALNTPIMVVELTGGEDQTKLIFQNEICKQGMEDWIEFIWMDARTETPRGDYGSGRDAAKRARASMLLPMYKNGEIVHDYTLKNGPLEQQQLSFPKCARWDALDVAGYGPVMLQRMGRWWQPQEIKPRDARERPGYGESMDYEEQTRLILEGAFRIQQ